MGTLASYTNKTDHHDVIEILLKVALNTIALALVDCVGGPCKDKERLLLTIFIQVV